MENYNIQNSEDIDFLMEWALDHGAERQLRLFACACCRRVWHLMTDERSRRAVELAEMFANGETDPNTLKEANLAARDAWVQNSVHKDDHAAAAALFCSSLKPTLLPAAANLVQDVVPDKQSERKQQAALLRSLLTHA
jgi:hypothetical protein